MLTITNERIEL